MSEESRRLQGRCWVFIAHDLGFSIDLNRCVQLVSAGHERRSMFKHNRRAPLYFGFDHPPAVLTETVEPIELGRFRTDEASTVTIYDFGAMSTAYSIPFDTAEDNLLSLSELLYDSDILAADARRRAESLLQAIKPAVKRPQLAPSYESYIIFEIEGYPLLGKPETYLQEKQEILAQILGSESRSLSKGETEDLLSSRISYYKDDLAVISWNASLLFGKELDDVRAVLELANVQLLELVHLDRQLDRDLDEAYVIQHNGAGLGKSMERIGMFRLDGQFLNEAISNALKVIGDPYLARVYSMAAKRFGLPGWGQNVDEKLGVLHTIYATIADQTAHRRSERLELVIILLILLEIVLSLVLPH